MTRDMTKKQFNAALERHNIKRSYLGYFDIGGIEVGALGLNRRQLLAFLLEKKTKFNKD